MSDYDNILTYQYDDDIQHPKRRLSVTNPIFQRARQAPASIHEAPNVSDGEFHRTDH